MAVTESKGNGYALYNGVKFPILPSYDTDKYPYVIMGVSSTDIVIYLSTVPFKYDNWRVCVNAPAYSGLFKFFDGSWSLVYSDTEVTDTIQISYDIIWANHNIIDTADNTVYLSASDSVLLDGMNVIEWDGDTTGLEVFPNTSTWYRVLNNTDVDVSKDCVFVSFTNGTGVRVVTKSTLSDYTGYWQADMCMRYVHTVSEAYPTTGCFVYSNDSTYNSLFAYYPIEENGKTTIINFNDQIYPIYASSLSSAMIELRSHLLTDMSGSGVTITLGGVSYNIDSGKLSAATSDLVAHINTIVGSDSRVVVNGTVYGIDAVQVADAISELEAVLSDLDIGFYIKENEFGGEIFYITNKNTTLTPVNNEFGGLTAIID